MRQTTRPPARLAGRLAAATLLVCSALGCKPSSAQLNEQGEPVAERPKPSLEELRQAPNPSYASPTGQRQECLGRLVFDAPREMQWGLNAPGQWSGDRYRFTLKMHGGHDDLWVGNTQVVVMAPGRWSDVERMARSIDAKKGNGIFEYEKQIEVRLASIADLQELLDDPSKNINGHDLTTYPASIERTKKDIADIETRIANIKVDWHPLDLGLPQTLAYAGGPNLYAFMFREGRVYKFLSASGEGQPPFEARLAAFKTMLQRFKVRKLYEVPQERGICVPYGFIPDDGTPNFKIGVSLRWADRPGVIYTLRTGVVLENGVVDSEPTTLTAIARAGGTGLASLVGAREVKRIGPRPARIGALSAQQGGMSINVAPAGKPPIYNYSVYTGYGGWGHSRVLPYITLEMRSFTMEQEETLKANPPPLEESMKRKEQLLTSIRLRPTQPLMAELEGLAATAGVASGAR